MRGSRLRLSSGGTRYASGASTDLIWELSGFRHLSVNRQIWRSTQAHPQRLARRRGLMSEEWRAHRWTGHRPFPPDSHSARCGWPPFFARHSASPVNSPVVRQSAYCSWTPTSNSPSATATRAASGPTASVSGSPTAYAVRSDENSPMSLCELSRGIPTSPAGTGGGSAGEPHPIAATAAIPSVMVVAIPTTDLGTESPLAAGTMTTCRAVREPICTDEGA